MIGAISLWLLGFRHERFTAASSAEAPRSPGRTLPMNPHSRLARIIDLRQGSRPGLRVAVLKTVTEKDAFIAEIC